MHNFLFIVGATQVITADYAGKTLSKSYVILFFWNVTILSRYCQFPHFETYFDIILNLSSNINRD